MMDKLSMPTMTAVAPNDIQLTLNNRKSYAVTVKKLATLLEIAVKE